MLKIMLTMISVSFIYVLTIKIIFLLKEKVDNQDTKIYNQLQNIAIISLINEIVLFLYTIFLYGKSDLANNVFLIISKLFCSMISLWFLFMFKYTRALYTKSIADEEKQRKIFINDKALNIIFIIISSLIMISPVEFINESNQGYVTGPATKISALFIILLCFGMVLYIIKSKKYLKRKEFIPIILTVLLLILTVFVQTTNPQILLFNPMISFVTIIMYHTIENPDVKMIQQLEVAKDAADKANRAKTDFLSGMSHEIRTPLNAIVGFSDCIMDADTIEEAKENAKDIVNASQTLLEIVNGILDISKIEAGKLEIVNSKYNAPEVFEELAKLITPKMHEKGLDFTYKIAPDIPSTLFGDHANLKKIITNLLSNAAKYTEVGFVHYEVNCVNNDGICKLIISVEDSGQGIKKENVDKLFTKFQRLEEDKNGTIEGTGLGLAITKQLIELMGGKIVVHTVYGEGSKFTVFLNQKIETEPVEEKKRLKTTLDLKDIRILMVDDTPLNLKVTKKLLEKYNANRVDTCTSGFECLDKIQAGEEYDIILLDDMMPKMSGVITLQKLKEIPGFKTPTIALTANAITGMREKYLADGFDDYLAKPIEKDQLIVVLNQILGRSLTEEIPIPREEEKEEIPPVEEDNSVEVIKEDHSSEKTSSEELEKTHAFDLIPVVDINTPEETESNEVEVVTEKVNESEKVDRKYLEDHGVDVEHALELLGDMDMYNMTISDFMKEVEEKWNRIVQYKEEKNMPDYAIEVHSLKSDSKYLGFMTLADISYQHELKSKENDLDFVLEHFSELEEEYHKILEIAKTYAEKNPVEEEN